MTTKQNIKKPLDRQEIIDAGFSFCVISGGKRAEKVNNLITSIRKQNLSKYEIIIAGELSPVVDGIRFIHLPFEAQNGKTSVMRNRAMQSAQYGTIVMCDDDLVLDPGFADAVADFGREFDVLCVKMRNPDGSRLWDWATVGGPSGHRLMDYKEHDDFVYVSSGIFVISKHALETFGYFNENLAYYQAEDVEFSQRIKAAGANIEFCEGAGALHDDDRYTQFDDYPRRIYNFNKWEKITPEIEARGLYVWDGQAFPMSKDVILKLTNREAHDKAFCFTLAALNAENFTAPWKCTISADGVPFAEFVQQPSVSFSVVIPACSSKLLFFNCSDVVVPFSKGAFRDQRTLGCYLLKPDIRNPQDGDLTLQHVFKNPELTLLDQTGLAVFAPCMAFGDFACNCRALLRNFEQYKIPFGLELHSVDHWFSQLCFSFPSSAGQWTGFLKRRKYAGINLVCADASKIQPGFFRRARISRPGYSLNYALTTFTRAEEILEELKAYDYVYVFDKKEALEFHKHGIAASVLDVNLRFPEGDISNKRQLPNQRQLAATVIADHSSNVEPALEQLTLRYGTNDNISIVIYVVDSLEVVQLIAKKTEEYLRLRGQSDRISQTIISAGSLEALEELEFLKASRERINLLSQPLAGWLDSRLL